MRPFEGPTASAAVDISDIRSGAAGYSLTIFGHVPLRVLMPVRGRVADRGHVVVHWSVSRVCFVFSRFFRNIPKYSEIFRKISKYSGRFRNIPKYSGIFRKNFAVLQRSSLGKNFRISVVMQGAAKRAPAVQMGICAPRSVGPDGSALRGKPNVPITALPKARGHLLNAKHEISDRNVANTNIGRLLVGALKKATTLLDTWEERANELAERARVLRDGVPRVNVDAWHATNHSRIENVARDVDRLLNELRHCRGFWKTVAKDELLSADIVWDLYLRGSHLYAEMHAALEQAETVLRKARSFKQDHSVTMTRMEQASRKRYLEADDQEQRAGRPAKPECSSGSESDKDGEQHDGVVYVLTRTPRGNTFSAGDAHCRSIQYAVQEPLVQVTTWSFSRSPKFRARTVVATAAIPQSMRASGAHTAIAARPGCADRICRPRWTHTANAARCSLRRCQEEAQAKDARARLSTHQRRRSINRTSTTLSGPAPATTRRWRIRKCANRAAGSRRTSGKRDSGRRPPPLPGKSWLVPQHESW